MSLSIAIQSEIQMQYPDKELVEMAQADPSKFELIYNKYFEDIVRFVYQRLDHKHQAGDIAQLTFIKAMKAIPRYQYKGIPLKSWLFRIAINELNQFFRKNKQQQAINIKTEALPEMFEEAEDTSELEELLYKLGNALQKLKKEQYELINMRFFEKRSFREIGEILNITEANAKMKTHRVIKKLRTLF